MASGPLDIDIQALATVEHLKEPTEAQIDEMTAVLEEALKDDPSRRILGGGDPELQTLKIRTSICSAAIGGILHVLKIPASSVSSSVTSSMAEANTEAARQERQIIGVTIWFPPGSTSTSTPEQIQVGWGVFLKAMEKKHPKLKTWWLEYLIPKLEKAYASVLPPNFTKDSWHLWYFGVLPAYQGKGLGKKLFKLAESQAQSTKTPIALETGTDLDIMIYRRLGLDVAGEMMIESDYGNQKFTIMVRKWD